MDKEAKSPSTWGGARKGAGRKKKYAKTCFFNATQEVADILDAVIGSRTDFINACILKAAKEVQTTPKE